MKSLSRSLRTTRAHLRPSAPAPAPAAFGLKAVAMAGMLALGGCSDAPRPTAAELGIVSTRLTVPACVATDPTSVRVDTLATGLEVPWDVAFLPDGRALITERPGRIRVISDEGLDPVPWAEVGVHAEFEAGLLGIDVDPATGAVHVAGTFRDLGSNGVVRAAKALGRRLAHQVSSERGHAVTLKLLRFEEVDSSGVLRSVVGPAVPAAAIHAGGAVRFSPDGSLMLTTGEAGEPWSAQDPRSLRGKVLRFDVAGSAGPRGGTRSTMPSVYAEGLRNPQGVAWFPGTGDLLLIDHGPTGLEREGFRTDLDELNVVHEGDDLGWPIVVGATSGGEVVSPIAEWTTAIAPAGLTVLAGESGWAGSVFVTGLRGAGLERLEVVAGDAGLAVGCQETLFGSTWGRLRLVRAAPDGTLWVGTSNRDHRGVPRSGNDLILRIHPPVVRES